MLTGTPESGPFDRVSGWPTDATIPTPLSKLAHTALNSQQITIKTRISEIENTHEPLDAIVCPLNLHGEFTGAVALEMTHRPQKQQQQAVKQLLAGVKWLETMLTANASGAKHQLINLVDLVAAALEHDDFNVAINEVTNEIAKRFDCHRVSIGFTRHNKIQVAAISETPSLNQHSKLIRAIRDAMGETLDQVAAIVYPAASDASIQVCLLHSKLAGTHHAKAICSIPLVKSKEVIGVMLLERSENIPFTVQTCDELERIGLLLGPILQNRLLEERAVFFKLIDAARSSFENLLGPKHLPVKLVCALMVPVICWLSFAVGQFRISSDSVLEAGTRRAIVAPQQGYIARNHVRAGDIVQEGDVIASLDDKELLQEERKWRSQLAQLMKEYLKALAGFDRAEVAILRAKQQQAEAQLTLVEQQLARTRLIAPFNGLVVSGDLSQSLGSPVSRGEVLYEIAPIQSYRVIIKIDDRDIGYISTGQKGTLKLSGMVDQVIPIVIDRITPVSKAEEGRNYFRVEAAMTENSDLLRPGMEGVAKIEINDKKLIWIWTRRLLDWFRLFIWNLIP